MVGLGVREDMRDGEERFGGAGGGGEPTASMWEARGRMGLAWHYSLEFLRTVGDPGGRRGGLLLSEVPVVGTALCQGQGQGPHV